MLDHATRIPPKRATPVLCRTQAQLADHIARRVPARFAVPGLGMIHVTHDFRTGTFRGKLWAKWVTVTRFLPSKRGAKRA